jgi:tetratricopeptide (TPR) repeat protein
VPNRLSDSSDAGSSHAESARKLPDFVRIASLNDDTSKKEIKRYYDSGEEHMKAGRYKEARDDFTRVIALNEEYSGAFAYRGSAYLELGQFKEALADFNQALKLDKDNLYALGHRGITYREMGQYEKAWADFKRVLVLGHSRPWIRDQMRYLKPQVLIQRYYDSGEKHLRARQYKKARRDFKRVIALDRNHAKAFAYRGRAYLELKQFKRALADFKRARHLGHSQSWILDQMRQYLEGMYQK